MAASAALLFDAAGAGTLHDDRARDPGLRGAVESAQATMAAWPT